MISNRILRKFILAECDKLIGRHHKYHNAVEMIHVREKKRLKSPPPKKIKIPDYWSSKLFNPFYVKKHIDAIVLSISKKLKNDEYLPHKPFCKNIPKKGGGERKISVYEIPDAAVSNLVFRSLMKKNVHRFSSFSYAYRTDRNVHYAIQDIAISLKYRDRLFISEFDFSDFFGSISHNYLFAQTSENGFIFTDQERNIIKAFLHDREVGIPQGTSLSLFLANMVCWKLDRNFEDEGLKFARYADDTVIWSGQYEKICKSYDIIKEFSKNAGVNINVKKSNGISLLSAAGIPSEFGTVREYFDFLGYRVSVDKVSIKDDSVKKIKKNISYILYKHLIQPIMGPKLLSIEVPTNNRDKDFVAALQQIRRYLYGNLTEGLLEDYISGRIIHLQFKGLMSFYPLVTDADQLKQLDGWLEHAVFCTLKKRAKLFGQHGLNMVANNFPFNVPQKDILTEFDSVCVGKKKLYKIPSFMRIYEAMKKGVVSDGINFSDSYHY